MASAANWIALNLILSDSLFLICQLFQKCLNLLNLQASLIQSKVSSNEVKFLMTQHHNAWIFLKDLSTCTEGPQR